MFASEDTEPGETSTGARKTASSSAAGPLPDELSKKRQGYHAVVTTHANRLNDYLQLDDVDELEAKIYSIESIRRAMVDCDEQYLQFAPAASIHQVIVDNAEYLATISLVLRKLRSRADSLVAPNFSVQASHPQASVVSTNVKLETLRIEKFDGDFLKYGTWWGQFESRYHLNPSISKIDKFAYLKQSLEHHARAVLANLPETAENYDEAISIIQKHFGRKVPRINATITSLIEMKHFTDEDSPKSLRDMCYHMVAHVRSLSTMQVLEDEKGVEQVAASAILGTILFNKLPESFKTQWKRQHLEDGIKASELIKFIETEVEARFSDMTLSEQREQRFSTSGGTKQNRRDQHTPFHSSHRQGGTDKSGSTLSFYASTSSSPHPIQKSKKSSFDRLPACPFCQADHPPWLCSKVMSMPGRAAHDLVKSSQRCIHCLSCQHASQDCKRPSICRSCKGRHPTALCFSRSPDSCQDQGTAIASGSLSVGTSKQFRTRTLLKTASALAIGPIRRSSVRLMLDDGSEASFISSSLARRLLLKPIREERVNLEMLSGHSTGHRSTKVYKLRLQPFSGEDGVDIEVLETDVVSNKFQPQVKIVDVDRYPHLSDLQLADMECAVLQTRNIELLIGGDYYYRFMKDEVIRGPPNSPVACLSILGWIISGPMPHQQRNTSDVSCNFLTASKLDSMLQDFFSLESSGISSEDLKDEDESAMTKFRETTAHDGSRYVVRLPWKDSAPPLASNFSQAEMRTQRVYKKLQENAEVKDMYVHALKEFETLDIVEEVTPDFSKPLAGKEYYLPHRPVVRQSSKTFKCRPVFDASARSPSGYSLNDCLHVGPPLLPLIPNILLRFRMNAIGLTSDITKAFLQLGLHPEDRDVTRYIVKDGESFKTMRFQRVCFGINAAPFLLNATIRHHLQMQPSSPLTRDMARNFFVDNWISGGPDVDSSLANAEHARLLMNAAGMSLTQWTTNSPELRQCLQTSGFQVEQDEDVKVLGLRWNTRLDTLYVPAPTVDKELRITKRNVCSILARIFDPLGFNAPFVVRGKIFMQKIWKLQFDWDAPIDDQGILQEFNDIRGEIEDLETSTVPRLCLLPSQISAKFSLHTFCDASSQASVACVYLRQESSCLTQSTLLICKTKIAPTKQLSIPRLELVACLLGARLHRMVYDALSLPACESFFWSDSQIALSWIRNQHGKWKLFVRNRIREIASLSEPLMWHFVPTQENPADIPSRGQGPLIKLRENPLWHTGPTWLKQAKEFWPHDFPSSSTLEDMTVTACPIALDSEIKLILELERFRRWNTAVRVFAWTRRFVFNSRRKNDRRTGPLSTAEFEEAELALLQLVQQCHFASEIATLKQGRNVKTSPLRNLRPVWDPKVGLIVSVGRERPSAPLILLPKQLFASTLLLAQAHVDLFHAGPEAILAKVRTRFWIVHGRRIAKRVVRDCCTCRKFSARPYGQVESALPLDRTQPAKPFLVTGVDFAGPLFIREGGAKVYVCLFTCAVVRAVHLELVEDLSTSSFLMAFERFQARRGQVRTVYSDNALTFKKASIALSFVHWKFIPERSPWWGGFYERLVRSIKDSLRRTIGRSLLTFRQLETILIQIEAVLNQRPLTVVSDHPDDASPLTPSHFLLPTADCESPVLSSQQDRPLLKLWRRQRFVLLHWWKRWQQQYLLSIRQWRSQQSDLSTSPFPSAGDVVLVQSEGQPRFKWSLGIIESPIVGKDGVPRAAFVRWNKAVVRRPTRKLFPLELVSSPEVERVALASNSRISEAQPQPAELAYSSTASSTRQEVEPRVSRFGRKILRPGHLRDFL